MTKRHIEVDRKQYTITYDEYNVLDTITLKGDSTLIVSTSKIGRKVRANDEKIFAFKEVKGVKYLT